MNKTLGTVATVAVVALLLAVLLGRGWKGDVGRKQVELVQAQERYTADSADFALRITQLEDSIAKLGQAGDSLRAGWAVSREASAAALITLRNLIPQLPREDRAAVTVAVGTIIAEQRGCSLVVANCEARVGAERSGRLEALARLRASDSLRTATSVLWKDAERRAGRDWSLGVTGGYGMVFSSPQVCTGPAVTAGVSYRVRLPWPFSSR